MFRKIEANSELFLKTKRKYSTLYGEFMEFAKLETQLAGKSKDNSSGKASSYANYLVRLIIFYQEINPNSNNTFRSKEEVRMFKETFKKPDFKEYNKREGHFPSATLSAFERFIEHKDSVLEEQLNMVDDLNLDQSNEYIINEFPNVIIREDTVEYKTVKREKVLLNKNEIYPRNLNESIKAKVNANWKCEYDNSHRTFIAKSDQNNYMESHHLIPMSHQEFFEHNIDFADNIICLCPNCHRQIHHASDEIKKEMISSLYINRENLYPRYGIDINLNNLLSMYRVDE